MRTYDAAGSTVTPVIAQTMLNMAKLSQPVNRPLKACTIRLSLAQCAVLESHATQVHQYVADGPVEGEASRCTYGQVPLDVCVDFPSDRIECLDPAGEVLVEVVNLSVPWADTSAR